MKSYITDTVSLPSRHWHGVFKIVPIEYLNPLFLKEHHSTFLSKQYKLYLKKKTVWRGCQIESINIKIMNRKPRKRECNAERNSFLNKSSNLFKHFFFFKLFNCRNEYIPKQHEKELFFSTFMAGFSYWYWRCGVNSICMYFFQNLILWGWCRYYLRDSVWKRLEQYNFYLSASSTQLFFFSNKMFDQKRHWFPYSCRRGLEWFFSNYLMTVM